MMADTSKKKGTVRTVVLIVAVAIVAVLVLAIVLPGINSKDNELAMPFGTGTAVVLSGSMEPTLSVDDLVVVQKSDDYEVGDVVVYKRPNTLVIHRIIEKDGNTVITQGDANNTADDPISVSDIQGKMIFKIDNVGQVISAVKSPAGIIIIIAILVLVWFWPARKMDKK